MNCCVAIVSVLILSFLSFPTFCMEIGSLQEQDIEDNDHDIKQYNKGPDDFDGGYIGLGVNIGLQSTGASGNKDFVSTHKKSYSTTYSGTTCIGYQQRVCGNLIVGVEIGADFGSNPKQLKVGGVLNPNSPSWMAYTQRQHALSQIISSYHRELAAVAFKEDVDSPVMTRLGYNCFLLTNRYLGGSNLHGLVAADGKPGPLISKFICDKFDQLDADHISYKSFIHEHTFASISIIGGGDILTTMREMRNFITANNTDLANILQYLGENNLYGFPIYPNEAMAVADTKVLIDNEIANGEEKTINSQVLTRLAVLLEGTGEYKFDELGIPPSIAKNLFENDTSRINEAIQWALSNNSIGSTIIQEDMATRTKSIFGISPYFVVKASYFFEELQACLHMKIGAIQMNGRFVTVNPSFSMPQDSFKKIAPYGAIGISKNIDKNWGINFEVSRAFKVTKEIPITTQYGMTTSNRASVSKTTASLTITYHFH